MTNCAFTGVNKDTASGDGHQQLQICVPKLTELDQLTNTGVLSPVEKVKCDLIIVIN